MDKPATQRSSRIREAIRIHLLSRPLLHTRPFGAGVLDIGCGWGFYLKINPRACGMDLDEPALTELASQGRRVVRADLLEPFPFRESSFQAAICHDVLEHFELAEAERILTEAHRVLRPEGILLILIPHRRGYDFGCRTGAGHRHFLTPEEAMKMAAGGFDLIRQYAHPLPRWAGQRFVHNKEALLLKKI